MSLLDTEIVVGWPQAIVALGLILGPQIGAWISTARGTSASRKVERTLTTHNGGSHILDQLARIEHSVGDLNRRVTRMETTKKGRRR